ncbi:hypothetical protein LGR97_14860 [Klebsiella quasipneumoniae subsp. similipneumoniae]|uniref:hypothetical protein n=1 Tax=Klebsiella pneumoniae complex TaxID=3390273 RepID=UPI001C276F50|nr:hypothetical protein [Klebsiella quasipneumoniae]MBV0603084.1 hypothetical protein [Klebsiella pneumoniae]MBV0610482.1 hypothetical protein [Klebsiella pneumoniae]MBV0629637.1 hypothetical protein [Klebsiella pneumoniae]MBV0634833.1 hypothetical protein [Klebsiella pneumoniae]MBV0640283.1 hypothetical protein [Klebsiella pneumoniae]
MSTNWNRHFELQLVDEKGQGISLSDFKVTFTIERNDNRWPALATVKIYNLSPETRNRIMLREYSKITMIAGYDGLDSTSSDTASASEVGKVRYVTNDTINSPDGSNYGVIFSGDIAFTVEGKDNVTDHYVRIQAFDGDKAFVEAQISTSLAAGYTLRDEYDLLMKHLEPFGIQKGVEPVFPDTVYPRAASYHGLVNNYLSRLADDLQATWQFSFGKVDFIQKDVAKHRAIVLNADTGLIGMPQQTIGAGVNVTCLINSFIQLHGLIQLDQASVYRAQLSDEQVLQAGGIAPEQEVNGNLVTSGLVQKETPYSIATDGVYIVRYIALRGDTRGQEWYMDLACEARGNADVPSGSYMLKQDS